MVWDEISGTVHDDDDDEGLSIQKKKNYVRFWISTESLWYKILVENMKVNTLLTLKHITDLLYWQHSQNVLRDLLYLESEE